MKLLTREQARELDRIAINQMGIPGVELMGKAGSAGAAARRPQGELRSGAGDGRIN